MMGDVMQHVVVEANASGDVSLAGAVNVELDEDIGLFGHAVDF
jgi:hypothetical protein